MELKIKETIDGMMFQIQSHGMKAPTVKLYQKVCNTIIKYAAVNGEVNYSDCLVDSFLANREQQNKDGQICNEYFRFIKRVTRLLFTPPRENK